MSQPGLTREEQTFLNRMSKDYLKDQLPNQEQVRFDNGRLVGLALKLNEQLEKMMRREA